MRATDAGGLENPLDARSGQARWPQRAFARIETKEHSMWKPEIILTFVNARKLAAEYDRRSLSGRDDDSMQMRQREAVGEQHAFARLASLLCDGDNPDQMLAKVQEAKEATPPVLAEDGIATFQYAQACREVASMIRDYFGRVEWNVPERASYCLL